MVISVAGSSPPGTLRAGHGLAQPDLLWVTLLLLLQPLLGDTQPLSWHSESHQPQFPISRWFPGTEPSPRALSVPITPNRPSLAPTSSINMMEGAQEPLLVPQHPGRSVTKGKEKA